MPTEPERRSLRSLLTRRGPAVAITAAHRGLTEDVRARQRRYVIAMVIRTVCVVLMMVFWQRYRLLAAAALVGGVLIPYVAVVIAQGGRRGPGAPLPPVPAQAPEPERPSVELVVLEPTLVIPGPAHSRPPGAP